MRITHLIVAICFTIYAGGAFANDSKHAGSKCSQIRVLSPKSLIEKKAERFFQRYKILSLRRLITTHDRIKRKPWKDEPRAMSLPGAKRVTFLGAFDKTQETIFKAQTNKKRQRIEKNHGLRFETTPHRERASYLTALHLGFMQLVMPTEIVEMNGVVGTMQAVASGLNNYQLLRDRAAHKKINWDHVYGLLVLDYITNQGDRSRNILSSPRGNELHTVAIDNELSFGVRDHWTQKPPHLFLELAASHNPPPPSPKHVRRILQVDIKGWRADLKGAGLSRGEVKQAVERLRNVQKNGLGALVEKDQPYFSYIPGLSSDGFHKLRRLWDSVHPASSRLTRCATSAKIR